MSSNPQQESEEIQRVEVAVVDTNSQNPPANQTTGVNNTMNSNISNSLSATLEAEVLNLLTQVHEVNDSELRQKNTELLTYLAKLIELLKDKTDECNKLEKQNAALTAQSKSLKEVVAIVKDLLNIRNMEVNHLQQDMTSMQEKINNERAKQSSMLEKMEHIAKLNQSLKEEYAKQYGNFQNVRTMYEEKIEILQTENRRLQNLNTNSNSVHEVNNTNQINDRLNDITLSLNAIPPFDDANNENVEK